MSRGSTNDDGGSMSSHADCSGEGASCAPAAAAHDLIDDDDDEEGGNGEGKGGKGHGHGGTTDGELGAAPRGAEKARDGEETIDGSPARGEGRERLRPPSPTSSVTPDLQVPLRNYILPCALPVLLSY